MDKMQDRKGFTIVELLIVIVVIAILAAITIVAYNGIQLRTRDTIRINDLKSIQKAVELYKAENGQYPIVGSWTGYCVNYGSTATYIPGISSYFPTQPIDPRWKNSSDNKCYIYRSNGTDYMALAWGSAESICSGDPGNACNSADIRAMDRPSYNEATFAVYSPGASTW